MIWVALVSLLLALWFYKNYVKPLNLWKDTNIPFIPSVPVFGNSFRVMLQKVGLCEWSQDIYNTHPDSRYIGIFQFTVPMLMIRDLELVKQITIKDFDQMMNRSPFLTEEMEPLFGKNLVALQGDRWKQMRATMSPTFTGSKMRSMMVLMMECGDKFVSHFDKVIAPNETLTVELKDIFSRYANDVIASTVFGIQCDSLANRENQFFMMGKEASNFSTSILFKAMLQQSLPSVAKALNIKVFHDRIADFFGGIVKDNIKERLEKGIVRPDMIHLLLEARKGKLRTDNEKELNTGFATVEESSIGQDTKQPLFDLSDDTIIAQAFIFFIAGFDSISNSMCHTAYELAIHNDVQVRLREEIDNTLVECEGNLTYEVLMKMKYLDMVVSESLRKWPGGPFVDRVCTNQYTIPATNPNESPVTLEKGQTVIIPIYSIHRDPNYFPNPEKFDPERFSDKNKDKILPSSYMPFGAGPRNCIASRFALMEVKTAIFYMLSKYEFVLIAKSQVPIVLTKKTISLMAENGFWVGLRHRKPKQN